jgi:hypothetical protein
MSALERAQKLAAKGLPVFPCKNRPGTEDDKAPLTARGFHDATCDPDSVHRWWSRWPDALIGVPAGIKFVVIDGDLQHVDAQKWFDDNRHRLPVTRTHCTRSGGRHWLFAPTDLVKCSTGRLGPHIDTRGLGGYIIWWPACGLEMLHDGILSPMPAWVIEALQPPPPAPFTPRWETMNPDRAQRQLAGIVRVIAWANEGERNAKAFWGACRIAEMTREGFLKRDDGIAVVVEAAARAGLPRTEAASTARSAFRKVIGV